MQSISCLNQHFPDAWVMVSCLNEEYLLQLELNKSQVLGVEQSKARYSGHLSARLYRGRLVRLMGGKKKYYKKGS